MKTTLGAGSEQVSFPCNTMTSLRAFQDEIEEIQQREVSKVRAKTFAEREVPKEKVAKKDTKGARKDAKDKDTKKNVQDTKDAKTTKAAADTRDAKVTAHIKETEIANDVADVQPVYDEEDSISDVEAKIQVRKSTHCLLCYLTFTLSRYYYRWIPETATKLETWWLGF